MTKLAVSMLVAAAVAGSVMPPARAQGYPEKPIRIVVGFAPLKPAEFVVIKLQQIAGQIEV